jgi:hypothetical protein
VDNCEKVVEKGVFWWKSWLGWWNGRFCQDPYIGVLRKFLTTYTPEIYSGRTPVL